MKGMEGSSGDREARRSVLGQQSFVRRGLPGKQSVRRICAAGLHPGRCPRTSFVFVPRLHVPRAEAVAQNISR